MEIGRELKGSELKAGTVVVIKVPDHPTGLHITVWVKSVAGPIVEFRAGEVNWHIINFILPDGSIRDDKHRTVHVYEYLGEI